MSKTIKEIATKVLQKIGRLPSNQTMSAGHEKSVTDEYDGLYDELLNDSLVNWAKADDIPDFAFHPITIMLCGRVADDFRVPDKWSQRETQQRMKLAKQLESPYVPEVTQMESY